MPESQQQLQGASPLSDASRSLLIIDSDLDYLATLTHCLQEVAPDDPLKIGPIRTVPTYKEAFFELMFHRFDLVILNPRLVDSLPVDSLRGLSLFFSHSCFLICLKEEDLIWGTPFLEQGAQDYFPKTSFSPSQLRGDLFKAHSRKKAQQHLLAQSLDAQKLLGLLDLVLDHTDTQNFLKECLGLIGKTLNRHYLEIYRRLSSENYLVFSYRPFLPQWELQVRTTQGPLHLQLISLCDRDLSLDQGPRHFRSPQERELISAATQGEFETLVSVPIEDGENDGGIYGHMLIYEGQGQPLGDEGLNFLEAAAKTIATGEKHLRMNEYLEIKRQVAEEINSAYTPQQGLQSILDILKQHHLCDHLSVIRKNSKGELMMQTQSKPPVPPGQYAPLQAPQQRESLREHYLFKEGQLHSCFSLLRRGHHQEQMNFIFYRSGPLVRDRLLEDLLQSLCHQYLELITRLDFEKRLQEANQNKDQFLAMLAHEIKNPLSVIIPSLEQSLQRSRGGERVVPDELDRLLVQVKHVQRISEDLYDISKIERGLLKIDCKLVCLNEILNLALEINQEGLAAKKIKVTQRIAATHFVQGDFSRLTQTFVNLISNSVRYTPAEGQIELRLSSRAGEVQFDIIDSGPGVPEELRGKIFDHLQWGHHKIGGLGIGLRITKKIVDLHHGKIKLLDSTGPGAHFQMILPAVEGEESAEKDQKAKALTPPETRHTQHKNILWLDDNQDFLQIVKRVADAHAWHLVPVWTYPQLLNKMRQEPFDVLCLDYSLESESAEDVMEKLNRDLESPLDELVKKTIVVTAHPLKNLPTSNFKGLLEQKPSSLQGIEQLFQRF